MELRKKILLTDDDPGIQDAARLIFERAGYDIEVFANGEALLNHAYELPDVFILDKQLSGVDGIDICRFLKNEPGTKNIPVIMLSASPQISRLAMMAGADGFLEKPFRMRELLDMVAHHTASVPD